MARLTPEQIAQKAVSRASAAAADYERGIMSVTKAPGQSAAEKADKWAAGVQKAIADKSFATGAARVSLSDWQNAVASKSGRYAQGVAAAQNKIADFHREFQPFVQSVQAKVNAMPDTTPEQRLQRMLVNAQEMAKFRRGGR